jgi:hypothetical protein
MAEEAPTTPVEDDGAPVNETAAPGETEAPASPPEGYIEEKRYQDLRSNHDRINSLIDRARQGDHEALKELTGYEFAQDEEDPDLGDDEEQPYQDPRVDAILQERAQERETAILNDVSGHIDTLLSEASVELPQRLKQAILSEAWLRGGGSQIRPETTQEVVKEWIDEYKQLEQAAGDRWRQSKQSPHVSKGGTGATEVPYRDDMSLRELTQAAVEQARLANQQ